MSKVIVLSGSPREGGNTDILVDAFCKGASKHNDVEVISVREVKVNPCIGCNTCFERENGTCFQDDDMPKVIAALMEADVLVIASPVYFYGISSQLKAIVDRLHTPARNRFKIKQMALLCVGAASLPELFDSILMQYKLILDYFSLEDLGSVLVRGVKDKGDIENHEMLDEAFELGKKIKINSQR